MVKGKRKKLLINEIQDNSGEVIVTQEMIGKAIGKAVVEYYQVQFVEVEVKNWPDLLGDL